MLTTITSTIAPRIAIDPDRDCYVVRGIRLHPSGAGARLAPVTRRAVRAILGAYLTDESDVKVSLDEGDFAGAILRIEVRGLQRNPVSDIWCGVHDLTGWDPVVIIAGTEVSFPWGWMFGSRASVEPFARPCRVAAVFHAGGTLDEIRLVEDRVGDGDHIVETLDDGSASILSARPLSEAECERLLRDVTGADLVYLVRLVTSPEADPHDVSLDLARWGEENAHRN